MQKEKVDAYIELLEVIALDVCPQCQVKVQKLEGELKRKRGAHLKVLIQGS